MENRSYKILLIGEAGVGKTCLIKRIKYNSFNPNEIATIGTSSESKEIIINTKTIKLDFWDTAGFERYRSVNRIFHKNCDVVLLVYNITIRSSFEEIKNYHYQNSKTLAKDASMIITSLFFSIYLSWNSL